ncbi:hypothetical protein H634G_09078 [Metarhizium anisopliae BRIP 53293]|uniref:Uncharacterized protein n=1 Tax=Metarhizium anisopliae BRIP 53293 TaxID=1291518 RepID=A0A0D9NP38_METAN|nr:hypothetical protein H634G_09078 [Metarhizium anisopliae BRIP 53293]KJK89286.1 hypothetical protein H633G_06876 [Metarhizium anisopliae BRIP 53284]
MDDYFEERFFVSGIFIFSNRSQLAHGRNVVQIDVADAIVAVSTTKTLHHYLGLDMTRASFRPLGQWNQNLGSRWSLIVGTMQIVHAQQASPLAGEECGDLEAAGFNTD